MAPHRRWPPFFSHTNYPLRRVSSKDTRGGWTLLLRRARPSGAAESVAIGDRVPCLKVPATIECREGGVDGAPHHFEKLNLLRSEQRAARVKPRQPVSRSAGRTVAPRTAHSVVLCAHLPQHRVSVPGVGQRPRTSPGSWRSTPRPPRPPCRPQPRSHLRLRKKKHPGIPLFPAAPCGATSASAWPRQSAGEVSALSRRPCRGSLRYKSYWGI